MSKSAVFSFFFFFVNMVLKENFQKFQSIKMQFLSDNWIERQNTDNFDIMDTFTSIIKSW